MAMLFLPSLYAASCCAQAALEIPVERPLLHGSGGPKFIEFGALPEANVRHIINMIVSRHYIMELEPISQLYRLD